LIIIFFIGFVKIYIISMNDKNQFSTW